MLVDDIKQRVKAAMKAGNTVEKEILKVALGEIQTNAAREGGSESDEAVVAVLRKLVKANEETLEASASDEQRATLEKELEILRSLLPKTLDEDAIVEALGPVADAVRDAKSDGQATGVAMKHLKQSGAAVEGKTVAAAVRRMRG